MAVPREVTAGWMQTWEAMKHRGVLGFCNSVQLEYKTWVGEGQTELEINRG